MIGVVVAIVAAVAAGVVAERRAGARAHRAGRAVLTAMYWVLLPFVSFLAIARLHIDAGVGIGLLLAYAVLAVVLGAAWLAGTRLLALGRPGTGALMVVAGLGNTGYLGVPLVVALLGGGALGAAIAFDSLVSGPMFYVIGISIGAAFGARPTRAGRVGRLVRNPPLIAVVAGLIAPDALAPDVLVDAAHALVYALLVLGFFALGITLASEAEEGALRVPPPLTRPVAAAVGLRMVLAPALFAAVAVAAGGIPHAYLVQAAMPSGINSLVVAHGYGLDLRLTASALAWTTLVAIAVTIVVAAL